MSDEDKRWREMEARRRDDSFTMMMIGGVILVLGTGAVGVWSLWGYLNDGVWPVLTLRSLFGWTFTNDMIGLANIVNWLLDLWLGAYTIAVGCLLIFANTAD